MFKNRKRVASAWAKGLMFGKAVGAKDEQERILQLIEKLGDKMMAEEFYSEAKFAKDLNALIKGENNA